MAYFPLVEAPIFVPTTYGVVADDHLDLVDIAVPGTRDQLVSFLEHYDSLFRDAMVRQANPFFALVWRRLVSKAGFVGVLAHTFGVDLDELTTTLRQIHTTHEDGASLFSMWKEGKLPSMGPALSTVFQKIQLLHG